MFEGGAFVEGTSFSVQIVSSVFPLSLVPNHGVDCSIWTEGFIVSTDGSKRAIGFDTTVFQPQFTLDVFDPTTRLELQSVDADIRLRCVSPIGLSSSQFVLTGGTVSHVWEVENRQTGQRESVGIVNTKVLSPSSNVLQASTSGSGIKLASAGISAGLIESADIDGGENNYLVNLRLNIVYNLKFESLTVPNTAVGALVSQIGSNVGEFLTISQEIVNPPDPSSNIVDITATKTVPSPMFKSDSSPQVKITVDLPLWDSANESFPRVNIFQPTFDGSLTATTYLNNIALTGRSGTTFSSTIDLPGTLKIGHYLVEATSSTRTGSDSAIFTIYADDQDPMTPVPTSPCEGARDGYTADDGRFLTGDAAVLQCAIDEGDNPPPDPCEGLTGSALDTCRGIVEQFTGCSQGFVEKTRSEFLEIISVIGTSSSIVIQSGFTTDDDPICISNETIATFEILRDQQVSGENTCDPDGTPIEECFGDAVCTALVSELFEARTVTLTNTCGDPIFDSGHACFGLTVEQCLEKCIADPNSCRDNQITNGNQESTGVEDKITATLISGNANPVIFYQVVYDGGDEKGIIDLDSQTIDFSALQFAGVPAEKTEFFELKRIIVIPAIDITPILSSINTVQASPDFKYTWSAEIIKLDGTKKNAVLETCHNTCSKLTMTTQGVQIKSSIIGVNLCADESLTATEKTTCEQSPEKTFYQIGSSDIQPNELDKAFADAFPNTILEQGDLVTIKVVIEGGFQPKIDGVVQQAVITPMEWSHSFTWIPQFGADKEPCAELSGQAQITCEGNDFSAAGTCKDLTPLECSKKFPAKDFQGCKDTVVDDPVKGTTQTIRLCYGDPNDDSKDAGSFGGETIGSKGDPGVLGIAECPEGTTATDCADILLEILEQRLAGILGIGGSTITAISNNAVLIIGSIIAILVIAIIARVALRKKFRRF